MVMSTKLTDLSSMHPWLRLTSEASVSRLHLDTHRDSSSWHPPLRLLIVSSVMFCHSSNSTMLPDQNLQVAGRKLELTCFT